MSFIAVVALAIGLSVACVLMLIGAVELYMWVKVRRHVKKHMHDWEHEYRELVDRYRRP